MLSPGGSSSTIKSTRFSARNIAISATTLASGIGLYSYVNHQMNSKCRPRFQITSTLSDSIAGALGEMTQIAILYPLDTIKVRFEAVGLNARAVIWKLFQVRCQTAGLSARAVIGELLQAGMNFNLVKTLYAGVFSAALCSVLVGAAHYASYEACKRWTAKLGPPSGQPDTSAAGTVAMPAVTGPLKNILAATFAAIVTALVEAPVELFRHNQQAGLVHGGFLTEMWSVLKSSGLSGLYWGFLPHCFEALPHDIAELVVYGAMKDMQVTGAHPLSTRHTWVNNVPIHAWDLTTGAAAGTAAVIVSMPFDCVKTYVQTHGTAVQGQGVLANAVGFLLTARKLVKAGGPGVLYVGIFPRLLQQVPSAMMCWWTIETVKRTLEPFVIKDGTEDQLVKTSLH